MRSNPITTPVKGGWVKRDEQSGRFMEVVTSKGATVQSEKSAAVVKDASSKRKDALKRLKDR